MAQDKSSSKKSAYAVFKNKNFARMFWSMLITEFGTGLTSITASILVYRKTGSALSVGFMLMATSLPGLLFGLFAGVFVDRWDRKKVLIITEMLSGVVIALIPTMLEYGVHWLYILVGIKSIAYQFFAPAHEAVFPDVISDEELASANSIISTGGIGAIGAGFAAAGYIAAQWNVDTAFYIDSATFFISGLIILSIAIPSTKVETESSVKAVISNLKEGFVYIKNTSILSSVIWVGIPIGIIFGLWNSAMLPFADRALGASEFEYSLIEGVGLVGFVLGGLVMTSLSDRLREGQWLVIGMVMMGIICILFSKTNSIYMAIIYNLLVLFFNVPLFIALRLIIQRNTSTEVRGRVAAAKMVQRDASFVAGMMMVGIADIYPIRDVLFWASIALVVSGILASVMPGLHRSYKEWAHSIELLRGISEAPGLDTGRSVTVSDFDRLIELFPSLQVLGVHELHDIMADITYTEAPEGTLIIHQGERNDNAYFVLEGKAIAGHIEEDGSERILGILNAGDFFGEIAALTHVPRTANVLAKTDIVLLRIPDHTLLTMSEHPTLNRILFSTMMDRMVSINMIDNPRKSKRDHGSLRAVRNSAAAGD